jgi:hypothetical protein
MNKRLRKKSSSRMTPALLKQIRTMIYADKTVDEICAACPKSLPRKTLYKVFASLAKELPGSVFDVFCEEHLLCCDSEVFIAMGAELLNKK